ncbi:cytochrome c oxidase subunit II [Parasediminibacterium sp. JCM 36343]|uniref:cytochrome c oxidase subunit II n=1 Tax=Parasediminibacterium sp. JCM 36343 TaxID=3374279 RepID=UPI00397BD520
MSTYLVIAVIVLFFLVIFQIAKASEYVAVLKGEKNSKQQSNKINGFLMVVFLVAGLVGVWYCNELYYPKTLLVQGAASVQGEKVDSMLMLTLWVTGAVFVGTQALLFWFAYKYQEKENNKVFYFPHNTNLELLWTVVPAIVLTVLVVIGLRNWFSFTGEAPKDAQVIEVTGKQFGWIFRYPGADKELGKKYYKNIDNASNSLGLVWDDKMTHDDIVTEQTVYVVKEKPVKFIIGSRDVIHDVGLVHFRMKMDAVPGIPTTMWFTPKYTTKEMQDRTKNPNFQYEISCDQMCGNGHYSMKGIIQVVTQAEFDAWQAKQKPYYFAAFPEKDPSAKQAMDSAKPATAKVPVVVPAKAEVKI